MSRSSTEWAVLDELRKHWFNTSSRGSKPDDPGWHSCQCGWEGYWSDWWPHVAELVVAKLDARSKCAHCDVFIRKAANNIWIAEDGSPRMRLHRGTGVSAQVAETGRTHINPRRADD